MLSDKTNWRPLTPIQVGRLFESVPARWWIAGGFALDLYLDRTIREHSDSDIDILILRNDQLVFQTHLKNWELYKTGASDLTLWQPGEFLLNGINSVWCCQNGEDYFAMELMLMDTDHKRWVYRRAPEIGGPIDSLGYITSEGLPYLRPEIQLLYKANKVTKEKDQFDFDQVVPHLDVEARKWLNRALSIQFPDGHDWIVQL